MTTSKSVPLKTTQFPSLCSYCIGVLSAVMLSGYCMVQECQHCKRLTDLAMCKVPVRL